MTQRERVLKYLNDFGSITRAEGFNELGIVELPARICELQQMGYEFDRETVHSKNRYGEAVSITRYSLKGESE